MIACQVCQTPFEPSGRNQVCCSSACSTARKKAQDYDRRMDRGIGIQGKKASTITRVYAEVDKWQTFRWKMYLSRAWA